MTSLFRRHPVLASAFALASLLVLIFAGRILLRAVLWEGQTREPVAGWMTVGYVGHSWDLDPREIDAIAGLPLPEERGRPLTLDQIAAERGVPVAEIIALVEDAVARLREDAP